MLLYNSPVSGNCYKVRLLLAHLGLRYETVDVDRSNRAELLGELNPGLRVPTLVLDDGRPLAESNAILWYFGGGTQYVPDDRYERAQVLRWCFFEQYSAPGTRVLAGKATLLKAQAVNTLLSVRQESRTHQLRRVVRYARASEWVAQEPQTVERCRTHR